MSAHPPLAWKQVKAWATDNQVPDDAVVLFDTGRHVAQVTGWTTDGTLATVANGTPATWGQIKGRLLFGLVWVVVAGDLACIRDLGLWDEGDGTPQRLTLQAHWG